GEIDFSLGIFPSGCRWWRCFARRRSTRRTEDLEQLLYWIVVLVHDSLLACDDGVVRNLDALRTDFRAAFGDVAVSQAEFVLEQRQAVAGVERVHLQAGNADQKPRPAKFFLTIVVAEHVADVLTQEALDALAELLHAVGLGLRELSRPVRAKLEAGDLLVDAKVPR